MSVTSNLLSLTIKIFRDLVPTYFSEHMPRDFCLIYSTVATLGFWLGLEHAKNVPASEAWHFLFPLSGMFFPQTCQWLASILHLASASPCPSGEPPLAILLATALWLPCLSSDPA